ncbi:metal-dependent hydrolase [Paenibacillus sp. N1-5-1-14]|uniref:metal-dependent hydrolase n=1 Tax=Paenibacillus radicibacter TaxID=2972488 RepID=UPI002159A0F1|nr:metal-dependent hydrolase [Paenibacillus radicibacter]MCR8645309.1 metal-dependent hydrolase [Paenibacillus radicibacter]
MDTGTHLVVGFGLAGLAHIDPVVASDPTVMTAVLIGTVLGSQAPDLDTLTRLKGNALYVRNHRGISHSLPFIAFWISSITLLLTVLFGPLPLGHVLLWVSIAVFLHVFMDLFNTYGTQGVWPLSNKWISWNIIHIFDVFIFTSHVIAIGLWAFHLIDPKLIFPTLYALIALYYIWRTYVHADVMKSLPRKDLSFGQGDRYIAIPTIHPAHWNIVKILMDGTYEVGELRGGLLRWIEKVESDTHKAVEVSKQHPDVQALLYFSSYTAAELTVHPWGYEVRWADIRYRHRKQYPFVAVLLMDKEYQTISSYVGWLSDSKLEKRLHPEPR